MRNWKKKSKITKINPLSKMRLTNWIIREVFTLIRNWSLRTRFGRVVCRRPSLKTKKLDKYKEQKKLLEDDLQELEDQIEDLGRQNKDLEARLEDDKVVDPVTKKPIKKAILVKEISDLKNDNEDLKNDIEDLKKQNDGLNQKNRDLDEEIREQDKQIDDLEMKIQSQHDQKKSSSSSSDDDDSECDPLIDSVLGILFGGVGDSSVGTSGNKRVSNRQM